MRVLFPLLILLFGHQALAQDFLSASTKPGAHPYRFGFKHSEGFLFSENADSEQSKQTASKQQEAFAYIPFYQNEDTTYALSAKTQNLSFNSIADQGNFVAPQKLSDRHFGLSWSQQTEQEQVWGLALSYGSASDKPFSGSDVSTIGATLTKQQPASENANWIYLLSYSNNRTILNGIPLPGFAYTFTSATKTSGGAIGIPFFSYWMAPSPKLFASFFVLLPSVARMQAGYMLWGPLQANAKLEWSQQVYMRSQRTEATERIFYDSKRAAASLKSFFSRQTHVELEFARVFDRSMFNGENVFEPTSDRLHLPQEWQISMAVNLGF